MIFFCVGDIREDCHVHPSVPEESVIYQIAVAAFGVSCDCEERR